MQGPIPFKCIASAAIGIILLQEAVTPGKRPFQAKWLHVVAKKTHRMSQKIQSCTKYADVTSYREGEVVAAV